MSHTPVNSATLPNWDGNSRKGQPEYDRQFEFEKSHDEIMYIIENQLEYTEEEVDAAYNALQAYK